MMKDFKSVQEELETIYQDEDLNSYIKQLVKELREDEEVYQVLKPLNLTVGEVNNNIAKLNTFRNDYHYCKNCPGFDACEKEIPHTTTSIEREGILISLVHTSCEKMKEQYELDAKYLRYDVDESWKTSTLRELDISATRKPVIVEFVKLLKNQSERWLYLYGNRKTGKSYLAVTLANEFVNANLGKIAVCDAKNLFADLQELSIRDKETFAQQMNILTSLPLVVLDNFGDEYKTEYIRDQIVIPLISERERNGAITIFTSEFTIDEIRKMYSVGKTSGDIRGKQLGNILKSMCDEELDLTGASIYRK